MLYILVCHFCSCKHSHHICPATIWNPYLQTENKLMQDYFLSRIYKQKTSILLRNSHSLCEEVWNDIFWNNTINPSPDPLIRNFWEVNGYLLKLNIFQVITTNLIEHFIPIPSLQTFDPFKIKCLPSELSVALLCIDAASLPLEQDTIWMNEWMNKWTKIIKGREGGE